MLEKNIAHIIPHSHWDREWRYPTWKNRMLLIEFMDQLLGILDSKPNYRQFIMHFQPEFILNSLTKKYKIY